MEYIKESGQFEIQGIEYWTGGKTQKSGTPYIELGLLTEKGAVRWVGYLTEKSAERTVNSILDLGFNGDGPEDFLNGKPNLFNLPKGVTVTVAAEEYNGKMYYKGNYINKAPAKKDVGDIVNILKEAGFTKYKMRHEQKKAMTADTHAEYVPF